MNHVLQLSPWEPWPAEGEPDRVCKRWANGDLAAWARPWSGWWERRQGEGPYCYSAVGPQGSHLAYGYCHSILAGQRRATAALRRYLRERERRRV